MRSLTRAPFAVNLFAPVPPPSTARVDEWARLTGVAPPPGLGAGVVWTEERATEERATHERVDEGRRRLSGPEARASGASAQNSVADQLDVVITERVPVFSFTFGMTPLSDVEAFTISTGLPRGGTSEAHQAALSQPTSITRVLTGRYARAVRTPLVERLEATGLEPPDYPLPRSLSPEPPMLAGQGGPLSRALPAAELVVALVAEADAALARLG